MTKPVTIPNTFATATTAIPLSNLDADFSTVATALNDANTYSNYAPDTGSANAYVVTLSGVSTTYSAGLRIQFKAGNANTTASTLNVNGGGAKNITYQDATAIASGTIAANSIVDVMYDGTQFLLMNDPAGATGGDVVGPSSATDNAIVRFDGTTGKLVQNSVVTIADSTGDISGVGQLNATTLDATNIEVTNIKAKDGTAAASIADSTGVISITSNPVLSGGTANGVLYLNGSKVATSGSALTFDGAILGVNGVSVGRGAGAVSTNTAVGASALVANTTGDLNTAVGFSALSSNTSGYWNTAVGRTALSGNTTGYQNNALGVSALTANTTGFSNTAFSTFALQQNTTGSANVAVGVEALSSNTTASNNTAVGYQAGYSNTTGVRNTYIGDGAGFSGTTAEANTAVGKNAGNSLTSGSNNTLIGGRSSSGTNNGAGFSLTTGGYNNFFGGSAGSLVTTGSKNTVLGNFDGNQGGLDIRTASNYIVLSDGDGNPLISTADNQTVALEGAVPNSGTGITFPATQSASSNANTLDDYEEGTWTPTTVVNGFTQSISTLTGSYTKTGNVVVVCMKVVLSASGYPSSYSQFSGLPFTVKAGFDGSGCFNGSHVGSGNQLGNALAGNNSTNVFWSSITVGTTPSTDWFATITYLV